MVLQRKTVPKWSKDTLLEALINIKKSKLSFYEAAKVYGISRWTLHRQYKKFSQISADSDGISQFGVSRSTQILTNVEEDILEHTVRDMRGKGIPTSPNDIKRICFEYCEYNGIRNKFDRKTRMASRDWYYGFLRRHPAAKLPRQYTPSLADTLPSLHAKAIKNETAVEDCVEKSLKRLGSSKGHKSKKHLSAANHATLLKDKYKEQCEKLENQIGEYNEVKEKPIDVRSVTEGVMETNDEFQDLEDNVDEVTTSAYDNDEDDTCSDEDESLGANEDFSDFFDANDVDESDEDMNEGEDADEYDSVMEEEEDANENEEDMEEEEDANENEEDMEEEQDIVDSESFMTDDDEESVTEEDNVGGAF